RLQCVEQSGKCSELPGRILSIICCANSHEERGDRVGPIKRTCQAEQTVDQCSWRCCRFALTQHGGQHGINILRADRAEDCGEHAAFVRLMHRKLTESLRCARIVPEAERIRELHPDEWVGVLDTVEESYVELARFLQMTFGDANRMTTNAEMIIIEGLPQQ